MKKRCTLALAIIMLFAIVAKSQSTLAEFQLPPTKIGDIQSYVKGDTVLISVDISDPKSGVDGKRFYLINSDESSQQFSSTLVGNAPLCGFAQFDDEYYLYYLSGKRKNIVLKALTYSKPTGQQKLVDTEIEIEGTLVGAWNDNGLFLIVYDKFSNQLKILQIKRMEVQSKKVFDLPYDFSEDYKGFAFIPESRFTSVAQGASKFKIYKIKNELILTIDLTLTELATKSQTIVIKLNIDSGEQSVKKFEDAALTYFRSFINNDKLYKTSVSKKYFLLRIHDLETGNLIGKKDIVRDTIFKETFIYRRIGADFRISKKETLFNMMKISNTCLPSVVVAKEDSCNYALIWATYFNDKGGVGSPAGMITNPLAGLLTMAITTAILQIGEPPGVSRYFYLESSCNDEGNFIQITKPSLRQIIDDYELALDLKRVFSDYKGYFDYKNGGIGVYRGHREDYNKLKLVYFEKKDGASN